ncbi:Ig-like domain-containing protein [Streptomyces sp. H10-C2]|uniref:L,D-transpeptidase n=1 Tax=unclassified Streptomyces TaxID=2593676 RepID=UPI0024BAF8E7|nr:MULTISPECIES: Ig-like domain-containing protein [unclassified Streptomyces]MDJ0341442.1 Ig-like domain-containing protein [Streptomyces sp. PH10-H1]MDJ0369099.1 Ig-like domain-containing protein [Streptomyces sp. H10-C2]
MTNVVSRALRAGAGLVGAVVLGGLLAGCGAGPGNGSGGGSTDDAGARTTESVPTVSEAVITITPNDAAHDVLPDGHLKVGVDKGELTQVKAASADGVPVGGALAADRRSWLPTGKLALSTQYTVDAYAVDGAGRRAAKHAVFTTRVPKHKLIGFYTPEAGSTVGTGMIISINFNQPVTDRAAVERAIRVHAKPAVEVAAHWFGGRRLDLRPRRYWQSGTEVTMSLRLKDVEGAVGVYGTQSKDVRFSIGRDQTGTVDADAHTLTVRRGGQVFRTLPVSAGSPAHPTYNGIMVIAEKLALTRMNGQTVGFGGEYDIPDVPHAMRLTRSGTFLHGNYWAAAGTFGVTNTSHGCIGLADVKGGGSTTPAGWLFEHSLVGDVVEVVNSHDRTVAADNGMGGWNLGWRDWSAGSALA